MFFNLLSVTFNFDNNLIVSLATGFQVSVGVDSGVCVCVRARAANRWCRRRLLTGNAANISQLLQKELSWRKETEWQLCAELDRGGTERADVQQLMPMVSVYNRAAAAAAALRLIHSHIN